MVECSFLLSFLVLFCLTIFSVFKFINQLNRIILSIEKRPQKTKIISFIFWVLNVAECFFEIVRLEIGLRKENRRRMTPHTKRNNTFYLWKIFQIEKKGKYRWINFRCWFFSIYFVWLKTINKISNFNCMKHLAIFGFLFSAALSDGHGYNMRQ